MPIKQSSLFLVSILSVLLLSGTQTAWADCTVRENGAGDISGFSQATQIPSNCSGVRTLIGGVSGSPSFDLFHQDQARGVGESFRAAHITTSPFTCALFDAQDNLLLRSLCSGAASLNFDFREPTSATTLGIMAFSGTGGGDYNIPVRIVGASGSHGAVPQRVVLNFGGVSNFRVNNKDPISYGPFDSADLGSRYAGQTERMRARIIEIVRQTYAGYNVQISTNDDPLPAQPYSTVNFGGNENGLLGLADAVNSYNLIQSDNANVYTRSFAIYQALDLSVEEMSRMVANVASHELGHLLGLWHTADAADIMDTTGSVWQLAGHQDFTLAELDQSVFPIGRQNSPSLLSLIIGGSHTVAPMPVPQPPRYDWWDLY
jgi:hypothetical protein